MKLPEIFGKNLDIDYYIGRGKFQSCSRSILFNYIEKNIDLFSINSVLEIGFGTGELSNLIYKKDNKINIDAFDISKKMYEFSKKTNQNINWTLKEKNWFSKHRHDKKYDLVFSNLTVHWIENYISELKRFSKSSKRIIFTVPLSESFQSLDEKIRDFMLKVYSKNELENILNSSFNNFKIEYFIVSEEHENLLEFFKHLKKMGCNIENDVKQLPLSSFREKKAIDINYQLAIVDIIEPSG